MKVAINRKYEYITLEKHCPDGEDFETWVMQDKFETHSILEIEEVNREHLRFNHFDYDGEKNEYTFNKDKYDKYVLFQARQHQIHQLELLLAERYQAHGRLLATDADPVEIGEVKDEIALILEELGGLYNATTT